MESSPHLLSEEPLDLFLLQLEERRDSSELLIDSEAGAARVSMQRGRVVDAEFGDLRGVDAARAVLSLRVGKFVVREREAQHVIPGDCNVSVRDLMKPGAMGVERAAHAPQPRPRPTLSLGTRIPLVESRSTLRGAAAPHRAPEGADAGEGRPASQDSRPAPGRWAKGGGPRPQSTGYSSVPPPSLAEERVPIPAIQRSEISAELSRSATPSRRVPPNVASSSTAVSRVPLTAEVQEELDEEVVSAAEGQLRQSEMPVPSSRLSPDALQQLDVLNEALGSHPHSSPQASAESESGDQLRSFRDNTMHSTRAPSSAPRDAATSAIDSSTGPLSYSAPPVPGSVPHPNLLPGDAEADERSSLPVVGRYEVLSRLKRGGMGSVYMCRLLASAGFRRLFAMKVLHGHLVERPAALDAFFHEARVLGGLHHPNIVGIVDVGSPTEPYIVLDYVEGGSLAEVYRATRRSKRPPAVIVTIILDALSGLAAAHEATNERGEALRVVHCDVTPHNLLVGIDGTCRLTDFGVARTGESNAIDEVVQGKPGYLAPERIRRDPSDHRSDIFSLGVILYAGLTGVDLFNAKSSEETMRNVLEAEILPPSQVSKNAPACFDRIALRALARDPGARYQSAEEMAQDLRQVALSEGLLAAPLEVASWIRSTLGPTLNARRVASMRGAASTPDQKSWATLPPGAVQAAEAAMDELPGVAESEPASKFENTGPIEAPPPSSHSFDDQTQRLDLNGGSPAGEESMGRGKRVALYLVVMAAILGAIWVVLHPAEQNPMIRMSTEDGPTGLEEKSLSNSKESKGAEEPAVEDPNEVVIPEIGSSRIKR